MILHELIFRDGKYVLSSTLFLLSFLLLAYICFQPSLIHSASSSVVVTLNVDTGISISSPGNTTMSNDMGVSVNSAVATSTFTIVTNDTLGYSLGLTASTAPAMKNGSNSVPDMSTSPATWAVASGATQFGFGVYGTDVNTSTYGTGGACQTSTSTPSTTLKYRGFANLTSITVASRSSTTTPSGIPTTICYAVGQNNTFIPSGVYTATVTATATAN
jgi:hypothetical protein